MEHIKKYWFIYIILIIILVQFIRYKIAIKDTFYGLQNGNCSQLKGNYFPFQGKAVCNNGIIGGSQLEVKNKCKKWIQPQCIMAPCDEMCVEWI